METKKPRKFQVIETQQSLISEKSADEIAEQVTSLIGSLLQQRPSLLRLLTLLEKDVLSNLDGRGIAALALSVSWGMAMSRTTNLLGQLRILTSTYSRYPQISAIVEEHLPQLQNVLQLFLECYNKMMFD